MFQKARLKSNVQPRPIVIELRDGRTLRGRLQLGPEVRAETLLAKAGQFLTIRTPKGDVAINRDMISALLIGEDEIASHRQGKGPKEQPKEKLEATKSSKGYDPCRILRVRPGATSAEIKAAWRARIQECHPDRVRGGGHHESVVQAAQREAAMVNAAYQTLTSLRTAN
ncbi:MAG: J domain-containing protein [Parvularculaceae bacterium]|nr:J domain-containing protein [Parvularculaceae bacterium]